MSSYSDAEIEAIAGWLGEGLTAGQITVEFRRTFRDVTRNAIIGIVHRNKRLALIGFARNSGQKPKSEKTTAPRAAKTRVHAGNIRAKLASRMFDQPETVPSTADAAPDSLDRPPPLVAPKILADLAWHECRWPVNDAARGEDHLFCAARRGDGPYCPAHARRAGAGYSAGEALSRRAA